MSNVLAGNVLGCGGCSSGCYPNIKLSLGRVGVYSVPTPWTLFPFDVVYRDPDNKLNAAKTQYTIKEDGFYSVVYGLATYDKELQFSLRFHDTVAWRDGPVERALAQVGIATWHAPTIIMCVDLGKNYIVEWWIRATTAGTSLRVGKYTCSLSIMKMGA